MNMITMNTLDRVQSEGVAGSAGACQWNAAGGRSPDPANAISPAEIG